VRGGNGEIERLEALGDFVPPTLVHLETALERCLAFAPAVVTTDLWMSSACPPAAPAAHRASPASSGSI